MDVDIAYFYNSNQPYNGPFGYGRTISTNLLLQCETAPTPAWVSLTHGNGAVCSYLYDSDSSSYYPYTMGVLNTLTTMTEDGVDYWKESTPDGHVMVYPYNVNGSLSSITYAADARDCRHTFSYSDGLLQTLEDVIGRHVSFTYASGLLESIEDWAGRYTTFQYDTTSVAGKPLLATVIGPTGCQTGYGYDGNALLTRVTSPNGYNTTYSYYSNGQMESRSVVDFGTTIYTYTSGQTAVVHPDGGIVTQALYADYTIWNVVNPSGSQVTFTRNLLGLEASRQNYYGAITTTVYDSLGIIPVASIDPLGNITSYQRDIYNNATTIIYADGAMTSQIYGYAGSPFDTTGEKRLMQVQVDALGNRTSFSYNSYGQITAFQDPLGYVTSFGYDSLGNQITMTDALGNVTTNVYDLAGNVIASTNPLGYVTSISYDAQNRPTEVTNGLGNTSTVAYDSVGNVAVQIDPLGRRTSMSYNAYDLLVSTVDMQGNITTNLYDSQGRQVAMINALGDVATLVYDTSSRVIATIDALGNVTSITYDMANRPLASINALGNTATATYDLSGRMIAMMDPLGYMTSMAYDTVNRPVAITDALSQVTSTTYDLDGRVSATIDALGYISSLVYDAASRPVAIVNALGQTTSVLYDALGRTSATIDPLGYRSSMMYDAAGRNIAAIDARGYATSNTYDATNRLISMQNARGYVSSFVYDAADQQIAIQDALGYFSTVVYDDLGRQQNAIDPLGNKSTFVYDAASRLIAAMDANGNSSSMVYDGNGWQIAAINALGYRTSMVYDAVGQRIAVVDGRGNSTSSVYDARGSLITTIDPLNRLTSYAYDAVANQTLRVDARGIATSYSYDPRNLLGGVQYPDGSLITNSYDAIGQQTAMADWTGTTSYGYDADNRQNSVTYPGGKVLSYSYDGVGNRTQLQQGASVTSYSYDPNNNLTQIVNPYNETTTLIYDALDREAQKTLANGVTIDSTYDAAGRKVLLEQRKADATALAVYTATYDAVGMQTSTLELDGSVNDYSYDATYQLTNETRAGNNAYSTTFTYDPTGNRLTQNADGTLTTSTYDAANQILTAITNDEVTTFTSDANGNQTSENANGVLITYTWDAENRMASADNGISTESFTYAGDGQRRKKTISQSLNYLWDGENILEEQDGSNALIAHYTGFPGYWGGLTSLALPSSAPPLAGMGTFNAVRFNQALFNQGSEPAGTGSHYYLFDLQLSNRLLLDATAGTDNEYLYKAFGEKVLSTGTIRNPFQFQGQAGPYFDDTKRTWMGARIENPITGRWFSPDPIGFWGGDVNLYRFVGNNPINFIDPSGLYGVGVQGSATLGLGIPGWGGAADVSAAHGWFFKGLTKSSEGNVVSGGGFIDSPFAAAEAPNWDFVAPHSQGNWAAGAYAGLGVGGFFTTADNAAQMGSTTDIITLSGGKFLFNSSISYSYGGTSRNSLGLPIRTISINPPFTSIGLGPVAGVGAGIHHLHTKTLFSNNIPATTLLQSAQDSIIDRLRKFITMTDLFGSSAGNRGEC